MSKTKIEEKETKEVQTEVYSYHTFMFPFLYEMNKITREKFKKCCHPGWFEDVWEPEKTNDSIFYNQYHYFNKAAHNAIYMPKDFNDDYAVMNLRFNLDSLIDDAKEAYGKLKEEVSENTGNSVKYVIRKGKTKYSVDVNAIRMKLYNTGVGILIFELENRECTEEQDIIAINDFGRRIYAPYYAYYDDTMHCDICAEKIYFEVNGKRISKRSASLLPEKLMESAEETVLAEPIMHLLSNSEYHITTNEKCGKNEICIEPVIDDRMFVACYYKNADFVDAMREWDGENYRYITHAKEKYPFINKGDSEDGKTESTNTANRLYTMMYVDGTGICCHSRNMLQNLLSDDHIYTRWLENALIDSETKEKVFAGTITGFSEYTMISVAKNPPNYLIAPFLTQYIEMAILALAQRASLLSFEYMISECARGQKYKVAKIQEKYNLFQSQLLLKEVSPQQQGIEIYDMLEKNLMIEKEQNEIKTQIEGLFAQKNFDHDHKENNILFWISTLGIVEAADTIVGITPIDGCIASICKIGAIAVFVTIALYLYNRKK